MIIEKLPHAARHANIEHPVKVELWDKNRKSSYERLDALNEQEDLS